MIDEVRELHGPDGDSVGRLICLGCDVEGYESEFPAWPCATAELVYTEAEVTEATSLFRSWRAWVSAANYRRRMAKPPEPPSLLMQVYGQQ